MIEKEDKIVFSYDTQKRWRVQYTLWKRDAKEDALAMMLDLDKGARSQYRDLLLLILAFDVPYTLKQAKDL